MANKNPPANVPPAKVNAISSTYLTGKLISLRQLHDLPKITGRESDDLLFRERIQMFLDLCERDGIRPGIETAALACGVDRRTLYRWKQGEGCSQTRREDAQHLWQIIASVLEQSGLDGEISPVLTIWYGKNWLNYSDSVTIQAQAEERADVYRETPEQIMEKYKNVLPPVIDLDE